MANILPAPLRIPAILPFATRAAQLEKHRPIISYWCDFKVVQTIIPTKLHTTNDECRDFTTQLIDKLEAARSQDPPNDAIVDEVAAKAYVEQFALETLQKADDAIHNDNATRQTVDTFQAASTFLELLSLWGPLDAEVAAKIKYAKYHALRIVKALRAGQDPNATNPAKEDAAPFVPTITSQTDTIRGTEYQQSKVEDDPDGDAPTPGEIDISAPPKIPREDETIAPTVTDISPVGDPSSYYTAPPDIPAPPTSRPGPPSPAPAIAPPPEIASTRTPDPVISKIATSSTNTISQSRPTTHGFRTDDESIAKAQKHAKWAISALNFEDPATAVKELRLALQDLGAT